MASVNLIIENNVVKGMDGASAHVVIPEGVTEIGNGAFENCGFIQTVTIDSNKFRTIGERAFSGCSSLERITIKSLGGAVGNYAFFNCPKLDFVDIPAGTLEIGSNAFGLCPDLGLVRIPISVMVIADNAFDAIVSKRLFVVCQPNTEAAKYVEKHNIPHRNNLQYYAIRNAHESANERRKCVGTRVFSLFGQSITAPNSLALKKNIINYYLGLKDPFFNRVFGKLPQTYGGPTEAKKIKDDFLQYADATVARLEKNGVFTSQLHVLANAGQVLESLNNVLTSVASIINELTSMRNSHLQERLNQLQYEAESKVTGLSYGVIGDSLTLALHAVDEYRARQKQRGAAYAEAQRQYDHETQQTSATIAENYKKILQENIRPAIRTITDAYISVLCAAELTFLINHGLMENIDISVFDENKSSEIIRRANNMDKEYAVGLALKTYPLNILALGFAGKNNLATNETLDYIAFMRITDADAITHVLASQKVTLAGIVEFCSNYPTAAFMCKKEIAKRCETIVQSIGALLDEKTDDNTAEELQCQITAQINCQLWVSVNQIVQILPVHILDKLDLTQQEAVTGQGYTSLGQRIYNYRCKWLCADEHSEKIAKSNIPIQEKIVALFELHTLLESQKIKELLYADFTALGNQILGETLPAYTGNNSDEIQQAITKRITEILGEDSISKVKSMNLPFIGDGVWLAELRTQYIKAEEKKYAQQLRDLLYSVEDCGEAFSVAKDFTWRVDRTILRDIMLKYTTEVEKKKKSRIQDLSISQNITEAKAKDMALDLLHEIMSDDCWILYYLCAYLTPTAYSDAHKQMTNAIFLDTENKIKHAQRKKLESNILELEKELSSIKGLFTGKRKKELNVEILALQEKLSLLQ